MSAERDPGVKTYYSTLIDDYEEIRPPVRRRKEQLLEYDETVVTKDVNEFEDLLDEVDENWEDYSMDVYHGTQEAAIDDILSFGYLMPSAVVDANTGEIPDKDYVSFSRSRAVAIFYAEDGPPTMEQAQDFAGEHLSSITGNNYVPDLSTEEGRTRFNRMINHRLHDKENLDDVEKHIYNLVERIDEIGNLGEPVVIGLDQENLLNPREEHRGFENELRNQENGNHLGEIQCDNASLSDGILYVRGESIENYRRMADGIGLDLKFRSLSGLKLRHELEMQQLYSESGVVDIGSVWDTSDETRPGLSWLKRDYDDRPHIIDLSG